MSVERHPLAQRFHDILAEIGALHDKKQVDYGKEGDPFANVRSAREWGVDPWVYAMMRISEKCHRLQAMRRNGRLANESATDSFRDLAVYALIAEVLFDEQHPANTSPSTNYTVIGKYVDFINFSEFAKTLKLDPRVKKALKELRRGKRSRHNKTK